MTGLLFLFRKLIISLIHCSCLISSYVQTTKSHTKTESDSYMYKAFIIIETFATYRFFKWHKYYFYLQKIINTFTALNLIPDFHENVSLLVAQPYDWRDEKRPSRSTFYILSFYSKWLYQHIFSIQKYDIFVFSMWLMFSISILYRMYYVPKYSCDVNMEFFFISLDVKYVVNEI